MEHVLEHVFVDIPSFKPRSNISQDLTGCHLTMVGMDKRPGWRLLSAPQMAIFVGKMMETHGKKTWNMMENDDTPAEYRLPNFETKPFDFLSIIEGMLGANSLQPLHKQ